jgi:hypothetical protein
MATAGNQGQLRLSFGAVTRPKDAPRKLVRLIDSEAQAIAVSMLAGGLKLAYVAAMLGISVPQMSRLRRGQRHMPDRYVQAFCNATGSNLLIQYRELQDALQADDEAHELHRMAAMLREVA